MKHQDLTTFCVAGFSVRTNNALESTGDGKIPELWSKFMQGNLAHILPDRLANEIYAVYTDYESDHIGDYTCLIGYKVPMEEKLPEGVTSVEIPSGKYAVVTSGQGPVTKIVPAVWERIWALTPEELDGTRSFQADFELYDQRSHNPALAQIDVYLGLRL